MDRTEDNSDRIKLEMIRARKAQIASERQAKEVSLRGEEIKQRSTTLIGFIQEAWHVLEPETDYLEGWAIRAMAEHLEAVHFGDIKRLLMNVPPGLMKSLMTTVFFPAWEWGPQAKPATRNLATSYSMGIVDRDALKFQTLIESTWYQSLWGDRVEKGKPWGATELHNKATGFRVGAAFESLTGLRGNRILIDDPLSAEMANSSNRRNKALRMFRETVPTRLNDRRKDAIVLIMQRLHEDDPSGYVLKHLKDIYTCLVLPMEFDPDRRCITHYGGKTFQDPRTKEDELLFPERFPRKELEEDKALMGDYAVAGQYQQRPGPREGGLFKSAWMQKRVNFIPPGCRKVRAWDFASTEKKQGGNPDATADVLMMETPKKEYIIASARQVYKEAAAVQEHVIETAQIDGRSVIVRIPQDPGQAGKGQAKEYGKALSGYILSVVLPSGEKERRAQPLASQFRLGNVSLLETGDEKTDAWITPFIEELTGFPGASHDDQVDAAADAYLELAGEQPGQGFFDFIRQQALAEQAKTEAEVATRAERCTMQPPSPVNAVFVMDGSRYSQDARGLFVIAGHHVEELEAQGWKQI